MQNSVVLNYDSDMSQIWDLCWRQRRNFGYWQVASDRIDSYGIGWYAFYIGFPFISVTLALGLDTYFLISAIMLCTAQIWYL